VWPCSSSCVAANAIAFIADNSGEQLSHYFISKDQLNLVKRIFSMVCVPCIVIPVLLYIWHRFLQPIFLRFYNPWAKVEVETKDTAGDDGGGVQAHPGAKVGGSCPFGSSKESSESLKKTE